MDYLGCRIGGCSRDCGVIINGVVVVVVPMAVGPCDRGGIGGSLSHLIVIRLATHAKGCYDLP